MPSLRPARPREAPTRLSRGQPAREVQPRPAGASAALVSNHGGRQFDGAPAALDQLSEIAAVIGVCSHCGSAELSRSELLGMCQDCGCPKTPFQLDSEGEGDLSFLAPRDSRGCCVSAGFVPCHRVRCGGTG
ncbi:alpha-hydroxy-acid oxidizing protein [Pseudonocardia yunnanensis]|uniref:Alpha-hydroxy-acid oxidizing protein n=1 Tax=Pseudonocardia yunnanensis TaxID=58107 RepID=A0ABW4FC73_9PSEU